MQEECASMTRGSPIKVLHVAPAYYPATYWGGPTFSTYGLCNALARYQGIELTVLTTDTAGPGTNDRVAASDSPTRYDAGYDVYFVRKLYGRDIAPALIPELWRKIRGADIVHLTATYSFPSLPTMAMARACRTPFVWSPRGAIQATHEWEGARRQRLKRFWEETARRLLPTRSLLHVTAEAERDACMNRFPGVSAVIIPNGVDIPQTLTARDWRRDGRLRLMYLSRLDVKKGLENLITALTRLPEHVSLDVFGTGTPDYVANLERRVADAGLEARVTFRGHVEGDAKRHAFRGADVFVLPSFSENFGIVVAEALAHGVPVITSRATPWAEVEARGCGLWVDNTPETLAEAVRTLAGYDLADMGTRGRAWVEQELNWDALAASMVGSYRNLLYGVDTTTSNDAVMHTQRRSAATERLKEMRE